MPHNVESGRISFPDGPAITWSRRELSPREARAFRLEAQLRTYRVTVVAETRDGGAVVSQYEVPGIRLHAFLLGEVCDFEDGLGRDHAVLTVEALGGLGACPPETEQG